MLLKQYFKFIIVGFIGVIINLSILFIFTEVFIMFYLFSEIIAFLIAITHNYIINKIWTFEEKLLESSIQKYFKYLSVSCIGLGVNLLILFCLVEIYFLWYIFAEIIATSISSIVNFFGNNFFTFRKKIFNYPK